MLAESLDALGRIAAAAETADGGHAGVVPAADVALFDQLQQLALAHHRVVDVQAPSASSGAAAFRSPASLALDELYEISNPIDRSLCLALFLDAAPSYTLGYKEREQQLLDTVLNGDKPVSPELYSLYADNLRRAVDAVPSLSQDLAARFNANLSRFAAYKAHEATSRIRQAEDPGAARATLRRYNSYQAAEYNTAVARTRTAKQWEKFSSDNNVRLFPNIRWIPSRSANPREAHQKFWNRIWPKDDPFWNENTPGSLWNCKCDWEQTNRPATDGNPTATVTAKGLSGNPAKTGQIFTSTPPEPGKPDFRHPYFAKAPEDAPTTVIRTVRDIFRDKHADDFVVFKTDIGKILFDEITAIEISKGAKTDASYFYKQEIALHFDEYVGQLNLVDPHQDIDSTHNNHNNKFYRRKAQFSCMRVYTLAINGYLFQIKLGEFRTGGLHLYSITEP